MTHLEIGSTTPSNSFHLNELTNPQRQPAGVALITTRIDEQMTLPDSYGYVSMGVKETIAAFEVNQQNISRLVPEVSDRVAEAKIAWDRLTPWLCRQRDLLSQRGSERREVLKDANLPEWKPYFAKVVASIKSTVSTVYRRMREFEGAKTGTGRKPKPRLLTAPERHSLAMKIAKAQQLAKEVLTSPGLPAESGRAASPRGAGVGPRSRSRGNQDEWHDVRP